MGEPAFEFGELWQSRCFVCRASYPRYNTAKRLCEHCMDRYGQHPFFRDVPELHRCFVTIMPEAMIEQDALHRGFTDLLLGVGSHDKAPREVLDLIFPQDPQLPCGQPVLLNAPHLEQFSGLGGVWTLDLSPYIWSGTLKDLRSWAVLSLAIEHQINHLAVWTAGNAGLSLAKMVHRWNAAQRDKQARKTVHCLVDAFAPPEVVVTLRSLQCTVAPISTGSGAILSREQVYHVVSSLVKEMGKDYWQVTDGWDGVGAFMYNLLARQCLSLLREQLKGANRLDATTNIYIVLPLGTGNLLLGFVRGIEYMEDERLKLTEAERLKHTPEERAKIVAALPYGDNMMTPFLTENHAENGRPRMRRVKPVATKLTGFYSPLSPCLWHLALNRDFGDKRSVDFIEVDRASQIEAAAHVFGQEKEQAIASEPSALIAFGALKQLEQRIRDHGNDPAKSVVFVVNSGFGIMGAEETDFYTKSIFAFR